MNAQVNELRSELTRQLNKWGVQDHNQLYWLGIIMEEVGEVAKAIIEGDYKQERKELIEVAACCINAANCMDRSNENV